MHGVRDPDHGVAGLLDGLDVSRQALLDLPHAVARDERHLPVLPVGVHNYTCTTDSVPPTHVPTARQLTLEQPDELVGLHARADLDPNRVPDPTEVLDVRAIELPRAVADPQEVRRGVVVRPRRRRARAVVEIARREGGRDRELTRHRLFEVQHQALVAAEVSERERVGGGKRHGR